MEGLCENRDFILMAIMKLLLVQGIVGTALHRVGSKSGWNPGVNYTQWSAHQNIYVNDWLIFYFDKNMYSVLEVNKTSYDTCNDQGFIKNITQGGRDVYQLTHPRPYYFLSGGGYCWSGMKVAITVRGTAPATAPAQALSGNGSLSLAAAWILVAASIAFLWSMH